MLAHRRSSATPETVQCLTPVPSPLAVPTTLEIPERILILLRNYEYGSFEAGTWVKSQPWKICHSVKEDLTRPADKEFFDHLQIYLVLTERGRTQEAAQALILATSKVKDSLLTEPPGMFELLFLAISWLCSTDITAINYILSAIIKTFSDFSEVVLSEDQPVRRVFAQLALINGPQLKQFAITALESHVDHFEHVLGPTHTSTLLARQNLVEASCGKQKDIAEIEIRDLLRTSILALGEKDVRIVLLHFELAQCLLNQVGYSECLRICRANSNTISSLQLDATYHAKNLCLVARCQDHLGQVYHMEVNYRKAIRL